MKAVSMKQILSGRCLRAYNQFANVMHTVSFPRWNLGCRAGKLREQPAGPGLEIFLCQPRDVAESQAALYGTGLSVNVCKAVNPCALLGILLEIHPSSVFRGAWDGGRSTVRYTAASCRCFRVDVLGTVCHGQGKRDAGASSHGCSGAGVTGGLRAAAVASRVLRQCHQCRSAW